jgi:hypothetical protein
MARDVTSGNEDATLRRLRHGGAEAFAAGQQRAREFPPMTQAQAARAAPFVVAALADIDANTEAVAKSANTAERQNGRHGPPTTS